MSLLQKKPRWYEAGLAFECQGCGRCCAGPEEGYVWVTHEEIRAIANHLAMSEADFRRDYVRKVGRRYSLREVEGSRDCIFLTAKMPPGPDGEPLGRGCRIYPVRPAQCRTWPFWRYNIHSPSSWAAAGRRCPGVNRGPLHDADEIRSKADETG